MSWNQLVLVAVGGALGAVARFAAQRGLGEWLGNVRFPLPILFINLLGCFLIGITMTVLQSDEPASPFRLRWVLFLVAGFLGSFTTFSTFGFEIWTLIKAERLLTAMIYATGSVVLGVLAVWLGSSVAK